MRPALIALVTLAATALGGPPLRSTPHARQDEPLAVVVNRQNPVAGLRVAELRRLVLGERSRWPNGRRVVVVMRETGSTERTLVVRRICGMSESAFRRHYLQGVFTGELSDAPRELATPSGVLRFVFNVPGAIGYVRARDVDSTVKVVAIDGLLPGDTGYPLVMAEP